MDITTLPKNSSSLKFSKNNAYIMSLCLSYRVNLGLSLRKTAQAMKDIHGISISHQMVANYCKTVAIIIKPFVDTYPYEMNHDFLALTADETYIKVRGIKGYIWFIMNREAQEVARPLPVERKRHAVAGGGAERTAVVERVCGLQVGGLVEDHLRMARGPYAHGTRHGGLQVGASHERHAVVRLAERDECAD